MLLIALVQEVVDGCDLVVLVLVKTLLCLVFLETKLLKHLQN